MSKLPAVGMVTSGGGMFANSGRRRHGDIKRRRKTTGQIGATITHREGELRMDSLGE